MRFAFTDEQLAFRDALADVLSKECPASVVRRAWTNADGPRGSAWAALGSMGVLGALVPEKQGGLGLTETDVVLLAEETGRVALPEPFVEHVMVGAPLVAGLADATADASAVVSGDALVTAGEPLAPWAASADLVVVLDEPAFVVRRTRAAVEPRPSVDHSRRAGMVVAAPGDAIALLPERTAAQARLRGVVGTAAQLLGLADAMLATTVEYVGDRRQFGVPVGSFQAVKHKLADVRIALEFARPLVYRAAHSLATDHPQASIHVSMAKAQASDTALLAARHALQCHGAMGYSYEYDLHLWMKRAWVLARAWGDAAAHREVVARAIL